jgi:hypothetical protein
MGSYYEMEQDLDPVHHPIVMMKEGLNLQALHVVTAAFAGIGLLGAIIATGGMAAGLAGTVIAEVGGLSLTVGGVGTVAGALAATARLASAVADLQKLGYKAYPHGAKLKSGLQSLSMNKRITVIAFDQHGNVWEGSKVVWAGPWFGMTNHYKASDVHLHAQRKAAASQAEGQQPTGSANGPIGPLFPPAAGPVIPK